MIWAPAKAIVFPVFSSACLRGSGVNPVARGEAGFRGAAGCAIPDPWKHLRVGTASGGGNVLQLRD